MKKKLAKGLILTCVFTAMTVSTAFASVNQSNTYQQQQLDQIKQQNQILMQQNEYLKQQTDALKQNQVQGSVHAVQAYAPAPVYAQSPMYYAPPAQVYYTPSPVYSPGPWYGGLAAGYILGNCGHWWGRGCCRHWR